MPRKTGFFSSVEQKKSAKDNTANSSFNKLIKKKPGYVKKIPFVADTNKVQYVKVLVKNAFFDSLNRDIKPNIEFEFTETPKLLVENGKSYYNAVSKLPNGKYQSFKVFVLPEIPQGKLAFRPYLSEDMHDYQYLAPKQGGRGDSGDMGGQYQFRYVLEKDIQEGRSPKAEQTFGQSILFKQDIAYKVRHDKNISEYVSSRLMNLMGGDSAAVTFLASKPNATKLPLPDPTGNNVYVGSIYYDDFQDLFRDIERVHGRVPAKDMKRPKAAGSLNRSWFRNGIMDPVTKKCRYHNLETVLALTLLFEDYDIHSGNIGVVAPRKPTPEDSMALPKDANGNLATDEEGKIGMLVNIDHANALRDWDDEIRLDSLRFWFALSGSEAFTTQPTNHFREIPTDLKVTKEMALELERLGNFDLGRIKNEIEVTMNDVAHFYNIKQIVEFGIRMGVDIQGHLRELYLTDDIYNKIMKDKYENNDPATIKDDVISYIKDFMNNKMNKRLTSMRELSVDMKVSLCFKSEWGYPVLDKNAPFDLKTILNEHPDYVLNDKFHFRGSGQKGIIAALVNPFNRWRLHSLAHKTSQSAATDTVKEFLGNKVLSDKTSNYDVTFYKTEQDRKIYPPIPVGVHHVVISDSTFKNTVYFNKFKNSSPTLSTPTSLQFKGIKPGEFGLNFTESIAPGPKGVYIEQITKNLEYQITSHRLPPELNRRFIYANVILGYIHPDLLSADPTIVARIQRIAGRLINDNGEIKDNRLRTSEKEYLQEILERNGMQQDEIANITRDMLVAEHEATLQEVEFEGETYTIPSEAYLKFAEVQCEAMMLSNGKGTAIEILPEESLAGQDIDVVDPILTQAYMIVCEKNQWAFVNKTKVPTFTDAFLQRSAEHVREQEHQQLMSPSIQVR